MTFEWNRSGERPRTAGVRRLAVSLVLAVAMAGAPAVSFADGAAKETSREGGLGAAAALSTLVYGPVKLLYATGGLIVGSFAWAFTAGDSQVAEKVFTRSLRGTYVITPDHLTGERELVFIGRDVGEARPAATSAVASAPPAETLDESGYDDMGW